MDGKIKQCVHIKFSMKLSKSATETLEMILEAFGERSLSWTAVFEMTFTFQGQFECQLKIMNVQGNKHHQNNRKR
jgi:hypothetical protein